MNDDTYFWISVRPSRTGSASALGMGGDYNTAWLTWAATTIAVSRRWGVTLPYLDKLRWFPDCFRPILPYNCNFVGPFEYAPVFDKDGGLAGCVFRYAGAR